MKRKYDMKHFTYIATVAASLMLSTSCVDLDQEPQSFITDEEYLTNVDQANLEKAATALYNDLWSDNYGFNCRLQRLNTCADDVTHRLLKANNPLERYHILSPSITDNTADFDTTWKLFYKAICDANILIQCTVPEDAEAAKAFKAVLGEAYFVRGLSYFYLVRLYGDVPLYLVNSEATVNMPRTSVAEIYEKAIVPSLKSAVEMLPTQSRSGYSSTPTKWAAEACLADVYMTMAGWPLKKGQEYYSLAASAAKDIIDNSGLFLTPSYADLWKESKKEENNEFMFAIHHSAKQKTASNYGKSYYPSDFAPNAGWADYYGDKDFFLNYPNDQRKAWNYMTSWKTSKGTVSWENSADQLPCISKYYDYDEGAAGKSAQANGLTCIYRYADVLLMYAEASTRATGNVNAQALQAIQEVQQRAGYSDDQLTTTTNSEAFLTAVFNERGWEFFAEMKRWFDLVRLEKVSEKRADKWSGSLFQTEGHYYFPIPYTQIQQTGWANNSGY